MGFGAMPDDLADVKTVLLSLSTIVITITLTVILFSSLTIVISDGSPSLDYQTSFPYTIYFIVFFIVAINIQKLVVFIIMEYTPKKESK